MGSRGQQKQPRFFYGWVIVIALAVISGWTLAMSSATFGLFIKPMRADLDFSQAIFGWANTSRMLGGAITGVFIGRWVDRFGPRVLLGLAGAVACLLVISLGRVNAEWQLVGIFAGLGFLGMSGGAVFYSGPTVAKWFVRGRAHAMGMQALGVPIALMVAFPLTQWMIGRFEWRDAWIGLGLVGLGLIVLPSLVFLRRQPEDMGLMPDGGPAAGVRGGAQAGAPHSSPGGDSPMLSTQEHQWTRAEALRSPAFWRLTAIFALLMFNMGSVSIFRFPHFVEQGVSPAMVSYAASTEAAFGLIPALTMSMLVARFGLLPTATATFVLFAFGVTMTTIASNTVQVFVATVTWGSALSSGAILMNILYPAYFGRRHIGAIRGISLSIAQGIGAMAGPLTGYVADITGSYAAVWWPIVALLMVGAFLVATMGPPKAPVRVEGASPTAP